MLVTPTAGVFFERAAEGNPSVGVSEGMEAGPGRLPALSPPEAAAERP